MNVIKTSMPGVLIFEPKVYADSRGMFMETWRDNLYREAGVIDGFRQDNLSVSKRGVLRGLHFQNPSPQAKLVFVMEGEVFDVAVDVRRGSPDFGKWIGTSLSSENRRQMFIPKGFAHGYLVLSERAVFFYKCDDYYSAGSEYCVRWDDPDINIEWPDKSPILSPKDAAAPMLKDMDISCLPVYEQAG
ncbi:MAG: dTDP-4-dehydrorhamnose 3,5-epimerase [Nitrospinae bacterium]|nr:dTDP-4-dehydrorhamnose 3,5-epimerase [Nitrospinota bacterium]